MNVILRSALALAAVAISAPAAAQIVFYEHESFQGRSYTVKNQVSNLGSLGYNDRASSVVALSDQWQVCENTGFGGRCVILRPGRYPSLASMGLNDRVSSVRILGKNTGVDDSRYAPAPATAQVTFYENAGYTGRSFTTVKQVNSFTNHGFNDRASSAVVLGDRWEACEHAGFGGRCVVLRPGRYPSLAAMGLNDRVSAVRIVRWDARVDEDRYAPAPAAVYDNRRRKNERLYEAKVTSVRAVLGPPEQQCWMEREQVAQDGGQNNLPAAIAAILGYQIGGGQPAYQDVQRCASVASQGPPDHWDVTYKFRGKEHRIQMSSPPGLTVTVNNKGEPRA